MIRKWDITDEQDKRQCIDEVLTRLDEQGNAPFGRIAAQEIIDIVATHLGPQAYNNGVEDARKAIQDKMSDLEVDLDILRVKI